MSARRPRPALAEASTGPGVLAPGAGVPAAEAARLAELLRYGLLDPESDQAFDDLVAIAAAVCDTPIAQVNLVGHDRQWTKAAVGMEPVDCLRSDAFCAHAILVPDQPLVVPDTREDPRFAGNRWVTGPPGVRFYAGAPLVTPAGHALGALCVIDMRPRQLPPDRLHALVRLARQAVAQMELRRAYAELRHHARERAWYEQRMESAQRQLAEENAQLTRASLTDELTGLPNRRAAGLRLREALAQEGPAQPFAVAIADIDHFKAINDRHGHPAGDDALVRVAQALRATAPAAAKVARLGGEEFVILLPDHGPEAAMQACEGMRAAVAALGGDHRLTVSIGLTPCVPGDNVSSVYARADRALYDAKQAGRDRVAARAPGLSG